MRVSKRPPETALAETFRGEPGAAGIKKEFTLLKTEEPEAASGGYESKVLRPTESQLEKINRFTKTPKTADEVVCFKTLSCNDLEDRDDDQFTTDCVRDFSKLPEPYSPVGKSYMVGHDYNKLPVGRIYDVGTQNIDGTLFLTNEVYLPNTEANKSFIENVDYGIYWAVSVGVMLGEDECKVCKSPFHWFGWWCKNGHEKGLYYDPESDETDDYGWPIACDPAKTPNAVKCVRMFKSPKDFYELSQVFLGAQYYAALQRDPNFEGIIKAASASRSPVVALSASEAFHLPMPHSINMGQGGIATMSWSGGNTKSWTDIHGLTWSVGPNGETVCHGKQTEEEDDAELSSGSVGERTGEEDGQAEPGSDPGSAAGGTEVGAGGSPEDGGQELGGSGSEGSQVGTDESEEEEMDKQAVLAAAQQAKLPASIIEQLAAAEDNGLLLVLQATNEQLEAQSKELEELRPKATLGDAYIKELRSNVLNWYVKANQEDGKGVDTKIVEKLIDACGDNIELIKELQAQYEKTARSRFPAAVRRSTSEIDPNERSEFADPEKSKVDTKSVRKLHG